MDSQGLAAAVAGSTWLLGLSTDASQDGKDALMDVGVSTSPGMREYQLHLADQLVTQSIPVWSGPAAEMHGRHDTAVSSLLKSAMHTSRFASEASGVGSRTMLRATMRRTTNGRASLAAKSKDLHLSKDVLVLLVETADKLNKAQSQMEYRKALKKQSQSLRNRGLPLEAQVLDDIANGAMPPELQALMAAEAKVAQENNTARESGREPVARLPTMYRNLEQSVRQIMERMPATERWGYFHGLQRVAGPQTPPVKGSKVGFLDVSESLRHGVPLSVPSTPADMLRSLFSAESMRGPSVRYGRGKRPEELADSESWQTIVKRRKKEKKYHQLTLQFHDLMEDMHKHDAARLIQRAWRMWKTNRYLKAAEKLALMRDEMTRRKEVQDTLRNIAEDVWKLAGHNQPLRAKSGRSVSSRKGHVGFGSSVSSRRMLIPEADGDISSAMIITGHSRGVSRAQSRAQSRAASRAHSRPISRASSKAYFDLDDEGDNDDDDDEDGDGRPRNPIPLKVIASRRQSQAGKDGHGLLGEHGSTSKKSQSIRRRSRGADSAELAEQLNNLLNSNWQVVPGHNVRVREISLSRKVSISTFKSSKPDSASAAGDIDNLSEWRGSHVAFQASDHEMQASDWEDVLDQMAASDQSSDEYESLKDHELTSPDIQAAMQEALRVDPALLEAREREAAERTARLARERAAREKAEGDRALKDAARAAVAAKAATLAEETKEKAARKMAAKANAMPAAAARPRYIAPPAPVHERVPRVPFYVPGMPLYSQMRAGRERVMGEVPERHFLVSVAKHLAAMGADQLPYELVDFSNAYVPDAAGEEDRGTAEGLAAAGQTDESGQGGAGAGGQSQPSPGGAERNHLQGQAVVDVQHAGQSIQDGLVGVGQGQGSKGDAGGVSVGASGGQLLSADMLLAQARAAMGADSRAGGGEYSGGLGGDVSAKDLAYIRAVRRALPLGARAPADASEYDLGEDDQRAKGRGGDGQHMAFGSGAVPGVSGQGYSGLLVDKVHATGSRHDSSTGAMDAASSSPQDGTLLGVTGYRSGQASGHGADGMDGSSNVDAHTSAMAGGSDDSDQAVKVESHHVQFGANKTHLLGHGAKVSGTSSGSGADLVSSAQERAARSVNESTDKVALLLGGESNSRYLDQGVGPNTSTLGNESHVAQQGDEAYMFELMYGLMRMTKPPPPTPVAPLRQETIRVRLQHVSRKLEDGQGPDTVQGNGLPWSVRSVQGKPAKLSAGDGGGDDSVCQGDGQGGLSCHGLGGGHAMAGLQGQGVGVTGGDGRGGTGARSHAGQLYQGGQAHEMSEAPFTVQQYAGRLNTLSQPAIRFRVKGGLNGIAVPAMTVDRYRARMAEQGYPALSITGNPKPGEAGSAGPNNGTSNGQAAVDAARARAEDALAAMTRAQLRASALSNKGAVPMLVKQLGVSHSVAAMMLRQGGKLTVIRSRRWHELRRARSHRSLLGPVVKMLLKSRRQLQRLEQKVRALQPQAQAEEIAQRVCETLDPNADMGPLSPQIKVLRPRPPARDAPAPAQPSTPQYNANYLALAQRYPVLLNGHAASTRKSTSSLAWTPGSTTTTRPSTRQAQTSTSIPSPSDRQYPTSPMAHRKGGDASPHRARTSAPLSVTRSVPHSPISTDTYTSLGSRSPLMFGVGSRMLATTGTTGALFSSTDTFTPLRLDMASRQARSEAPITSANDSILTVASHRQSMVTSQSSAPGYASPSPHPVPPSHPPSHPHMHAPSPRGQRSSHSSGGAVAGPASANTAQQAAAALSPMLLHQVSQDHTTVSTLSPNGDVKQYYQHQQGLNLSAVGPGPLQAWDEAGDTLSPAHDIITRTSQGPAQHTSSSNSSQSTGMNIGLAARRMQHGTSIDSHSSSNHSQSGVNTDLPLSSGLLPMLPSMHPTTKVRTSNNNSTKTRTSLGGGPSQPGTASNNGAAWPLNPIPPACPPPRKSNSITVDVPNSTLPGTTSTTAQSITSLSDGTNAAGKPINTSLISPRSPPPTRPLSRPGGPFAAPGLWNPAINGDLPPQDAGAPGAAILGHTAGALKTSGSSSGAHSLYATKGVGALTADPRPLPENLSTRRSKA